MATEGAATQPMRPGYLVAGRYRLLSRLGSGGMGTVWLARDQLLNREVAVKQVLSTAGMSPAEAVDQRARALREGRTAARLSHPHSVTMFDVAVDRGEPWLVMEHLPSRSLAAVVAARGALPAVLVAQIGAQVADALAAAHEAGVVHRDVKPGNVLLAEGGRAAGTVKITDFGISRAHGEAPVTVTGIITGTPAFFAPEVARGADSTPASDVFALGATLYAAVEGSPPFGLDENLVALLHRVAAGEVKPPLQAGPLRRPLLRMLEPDPRNRPTMAQARDELARVATAGSNRDLRSVLTATSALPLTAGVGSAPAAHAPAAHAPVDGAPVDDAAGQATRPTTYRPLRPVSLDRRHRRSLVTIAAAAFVLALLAVAAVALGTRSAPSPGSSSPGTSSPGTGTASTGVPQPVDPAPALAPAITVPDDVQQVREAVTRYYLSLPADTATAWDLLSPAYQDQLKRNDYDRYWRRLSAVTVTAVQVTGRSTAVATLELSPTDGTRYSVLEQLTLTSGTLLVSGSDQVCLDGPADDCPGSQRAHGKGNG